MSENDKYEALLEELNTMSKELRQTEPVHTEENENLHTGHRKRLKYQMREHGLSTLQDHNILELLLFYSVPHRDTNPLAHKLINRFGSLRKVFDARYSDLLAVKGVGENTATLLKLIPEISRIYVQRGIEENSTMLRTTDDAYRYLVPRFIGAQEECVYIICLDSKHTILGCEMLFKGTVNSAEVSIRKIVERVFFYNATGVILAHNHPGGYSMPSKNDVDTTNQIKLALESMSVHLIDHLIITEEECVKYAASHKLT